MNAKTIKTTPTTTCQICGRSILANTGKIAHHGYKRPGGGWQTASCMGARYQPYEQSCDRIAEVIEYIRRYAVGQTAALENLLNNPPETLSKTFKRGYSEKTYTADRPADFDYKTAYHTYRSDAYDTLFFERKYQIETNIKNAQHDIEYLTNRLSNWKPPLDN